MRWHIINKFLLEVSAPFAKGITYSFHTFKEWRQTYFALQKIKKENIQLKERLKALKIRQTWYKELLYENQRLKKLLGLKRTLSCPSLGATVIAYTPQFNPKVIFLDKGEKDGVKLHYPVISIKGAVGQIIEVSLHYAKVLTIIDNNSKVEVMSQRTRIHGIFVGTGVNQGEVKYIPKEEDIKVGDLFITSGLDGVFPKGISIGHVVHISKPLPSPFNKIKLKTSVDFKRLEEVIVLLKPYKWLQYE